MSDKASRVAPAYYEDGARWEASVYRGMAISLYFWRLLALVLGGGLTCALAALWFLIPLKSFEVVTLLVDKTTGHLEVATPLENSGALTQNDAVTSANIVRFIRARETYDPSAASMQNLYDLAVLYSTGEARKDLLKDYNPSNPKNRQKLYGTDTVVSVFVKAVVPISNDTYNVRFDTIRHPSHGAEVTEAWVANVHFHYTSAPMRTDYRFDNPLGFQVLDYRKDQEMLGPTPDPTGLNANDQGAK